MTVPLKGHTGTPRFGPGPCPSLTVYVHPGIRNFWDLQTEAGGRGQPASSWQHDRNLPLRPSALDRCSDTPKSRAEGPALRNSCLHWPAPEPGPYIHFLQDTTSGSAVASGLPSPGNPFQPASLHSCLSRTRSCFGGPHPTPAALPLVGAPSPAPLPVPLLLPTHHLPWESCLPPPLSLQLNPSSRPLPPRPCVYPQA